LPADLAPPPISAITTMTAFAEAERSAIPPLADHAAQVIGLGAAAAKPYDPAPLWVERLSIAVSGSRPNYVVREPKIEIVACDSRDMRCETHHADLARLEPEEGAGVDLVGSALSSAIGMMFGSSGKDRPLWGSGVSFRGRGRFVGLVTDW
jgi:hypothetical protein